ncbi:MAG: orotidine 5'-phosphate decarboxylase [Pseudomonadota bacterium]
MAHVHLSGIHYNPTNGAFEARADIERMGRTYRYPCSIPGTLTMEDHAIRAGLEQQAVRLASREGGLMSIR